MSLWRLTYTSVLFINICPNQQNDEILFFEQNWCRWAWSDGVVDVCLYDGSSLLVWWWQDRYDDRPMVIRQWTSYQIRKIARCVCAGNAGNVFHATDFKRKPLVSDRGMHHGTCVTHAPWCISGSLTPGGWETFPAFLAHAQPAILRIYQEAHGRPITADKRTTHDSI